MSNAVTGQFSDAEDGDDAIVNSLVNSVQVSFAQEGKYIIKCIHARTHYTYMY